MKLIRSQLLALVKANKTIAGTVEIIGANFIADEPAIFGTVNQDYCKRELEWYNSMSRNVNAIPGKVPSVWKYIAGENGEINSNYGWCIYSSANGLQYENVLKELRNNPDSRRAVMIYTRPTMHSQWNNFGMSDFICTNAVQYFIRDGKLIAHVNMRSNDAIFGYKNDKFWQDHVQQKLAKDLGVAVGPMHWSCGSLHIYERHYKLALQWGEENVT